MTLTGRLNQPNMSNIFRFSFSIYHDYGTTATCPFFTTVNILRTLFE